MKEDNIWGDDMIKDSGERTMFGEEGAVRDMHKGKGRFDLMPLEECARLLDNDAVVIDIHNFQETEKCEYLYDAITDFCDKIGWDVPTALLEVAVHFEDGAVKYGENNWRKGSGVPVWSYIDSALRHYMKWSRGDKDERHDRAFVWNILCLIWTVKNKHES